MMEQQLSSVFMALAAEYPQWTLCRVILQEKGQYRVAGNLGEQSAVVSGKFQYEDQTPSDFPAVGDYVMADWNQGGNAVIHAALRDGVLSPERGQSYQKLLTENAYADDAHGYFAAKEKKFKDISKTNKLNRKK